MNEQSVVVRERDRYRLVHHRRDAKTWPNVSDLTLERQQLDAMGDAHWVYVDSWCLSAQRRIEQGRDHTTEIVALKLLLDDGPIVDTSKD
jgi:hypothetical protein